MSTPGRPRRRGAGLIAASNVALFVGLILLLAGIFANTGAVIVVGIVVVAVAIALSFVHARRRRRRMGR